MSNTNHRIGKIMDPNFHSLIREEKYGIDTDLHEHKKIITFLWLLGFRNLRHPHSKRNNISPKPGEAERS
ncbi:hypothetical protein LguiA_004857 [Lonicera macranthoides]